jgi:hypothetical protein
MALSRVRAPPPASTATTPDGPYAAHPAIATITMMTMVTKTRGQTPERGLVTTLMDNCIAAFRIFAVINACSAFGAGWLRECH